jgi:hypothetical protein
MKIGIVSLGIVLAALTGAGAHADVGLFNWATLKESFSPAFSPMAGRFDDERQKERERVAPPQHQEPRREPPRQEPPRQQPRHEPVHVPTPAPREPSHDPVRNPGRTPETPRVPAPVPHEPRHDPVHNPGRAPETPRRPTTPPPANQHPPVIVHPQPGRGGDRRIPLPPKQLPPGQVIDPRHHGDGGTVHPPQRGHDGAPIQQKPWQNHDGRIIAPSRDHIGRIDHDDFHRNIRHEQGRWDRNDHDYHWHEWNGTRVCHHYDQFGFHWWGFYIGSSYFWARYYNDMYWWYDPYWHRWVYLRDGRWWWQDAGVVYVIIDDNYYRYGNNEGTVIVTPDPTPPAEVPPGQPSTPAPAPAQATFYSVDGSRSVQILGDRKEAFLYDLTVEDHNDARAKAQWLGTDVASAKFVYDDKTGAGGAPKQVIAHIELTFDEAGKTATVDPNGERAVIVSGDAQTADLYNLKDDSVSPVSLADGVTNVNLINQERTDAGGEVVQSLSLVVVSYKDADGAEKTKLFNRDGASLIPAAPAAEPTGETQQMRLKLQSSPAFEALQNLSW